MGAVYLAHDSQLERPVAVKFILTEDDPSAKQRLMVEARAAARLQHPNVVTIYSVGEVDDMPYIVSEFIRGTPLDKAELPVSYAHALKLGIGIARGLAAAHRRGVIHRDIKPANVILSDDGEVKILDFGIAKLMKGDAARAASRPPADFAVLDTALPSDVLISMLPSGPTLKVNMEWADGAPRGDGEEGAQLTSDNVLMGTPQFMAPEVWFGEPSSFQSDIYSFGMLLFTLCAGRPAHAADNLLALRNKIISCDTPSLLEAAPHVDPRFAKIVNQCLSRDRNRRFQSVGAVRSALERLQYVGHTPEIFEGNPYRGLLAFEAEHKDFFFGRETEIRAVMERLETGAFVLATGDSGVGKSSLCRAGVLPRLKRQRGGDGHWRTVCMVPGKHPLLTLIATLVPFFPMPESEVEKAVVQDPGRAARLLRAEVQKADRGLALLIDQLEELTTISDRAETEAVCRFLEHLCMPSADIRVLATARSDYLGRLAALPHLGEEIPAALVFINPLSGESMREAVTGPAEMAGITFESQTLVDELTAAAEGEGGALPLLQFTLAELWRCRDQDKRTISKAALDRLGGVSGALTGHADQVLYEMLPKVRAQAKAVLLRLVTAEGTRARKGEAELCMDVPEAKAALEALTKGRLLTASFAFDEPTYEIAHEVLIHGWRTLAGWLSSDADRRQTLSRLHAAAGEWERLGKSRQALWHDKQLTETLELSLTALPSLEQSFLIKSKRGALLRKIRFSLAVLAVPLAALMIWGGLRLHAERNLRRRVDLHLEHAEEIRGKAKTLQEVMEDARSLAMGEFDAMHPEKGEAALQVYNRRRRELSTLHQKAAEYLESALLLSPSREDVRTEFASLLYERAEAAENADAEREREELLLRLSLYDPNGFWKKKWTAPGRVVFELDPRDAGIAVFRYQPTATGRMELVPISDNSGPQPAVEFPQGSYRATLAAPGHQTVAYPFTVGRGESVRVRVALPEVGAVPPGYVYVPPGKFYFGSAAEDNLRRDFFHAAPLHPLTTGGYLISAKETTFADWFVYLSALPEDLRSRRLPRVDKGGFQGALTVRYDADGAHVVSFQPTTVTYTAVVGEKIRYKDRTQGDVHDWLRFPVFGISVEDALQYVEWLKLSGTVPGARLCTDVEWERAARGADKREYPHGDRLLPTDANFDVTYGRKAEAMGPDEVGSHTVSDSPFGLSDMAGNVWEWTVSSLRSGEYAARGGSYLFGANTARVAEREITEPAFRDVSVGMRVCADPAR